MISIKNKLTRKKRILGPMNIAGVVFLGFIIFVALGADFLAGDIPVICSTSDGINFFPDSGCAVNSSHPDNWAIYPPARYNPHQVRNLRGEVQRLFHPDNSHILGTDSSGRDVFSRLIHGARTSLIVGLGSMILSLFIGVMLGVISGYYLGLTDKITSFFVKTMTSFPSLFLILAVMGLTGTVNLVGLVIILGLTRWTEIARITRAEVMSVMNEDYIQAAIGLGLTHLKIITRHVLPHAMGPVLISGAYGVAGAILIETTLSFLGFGLPHATASWGHILTDAFYNDKTAWIAIFPAMVIFLTVLSINLSGEGLGKIFNYRKNF